ncbi:MAG: hypothetical protein BroJett039_09260 [Chloroflexota bacterium]|nr:MAG: hypothetical protein BroJett039_09260 [Chloroflexota bacterium]
MANAINAGKIVIAKKAKITIDVLLQGKRLFLEMGALMTNLETRYSILSFGAANCSPAPNDYAIFAARPWARRALIFMLY